MPFCRKTEDNKLESAEQEVCAPDYTLRADERDSYEFPVQGWWWFDSEDEAALALGVLEENTLNTQL